jgi:CRISPR/Cas system CSM-associated protein Csm3 (group 7 of RAMP superfamily)
MIYLQELLTNTVESITLTAIIDTALCVGAGGSSGSLADKPIIRNAEGKLLIPASQFKGRLRHECEKLARGLGWNVCQSPNAARMCPQLAEFSQEDKDKFQRNDYKVSGHEEHHCIICQLFGNPALPSRIIFDDLICTEHPENLPEVLRPGVTINRRRRTAEEKKLYFIETSPVNARLNFVGAIHIQSQISAHLGAKAIILAALYHINALGGSKSSGMGWLSWKWDTDDFQVDESVWQGLLPIS